MEKERLQFLMSVSSSIIYTRKPHAGYGINFISNNVSQYLGYRPEEFINNPGLWSNRIHYEDQMRVLSEIPRLFEKDCYTYEYRFRSKDGEYRWMFDDMRLIRDKNGNPTDIIGYLVDITHRKQMEVLLRQAQLEAELANRAKSEFIANMSDELRSPLNSIIGFSEVLIGQDFGPLNEKQKNYAEHIFTSGKKLISLIDAILDIVLIDTDNYEQNISFFSLKNTINNLLILTREKAANNGLKVSLEVDENIGKINCDEQRLTQIIYSLLSNAIKFTPQGGKVCIRAKRINSEIEISVYDTGIGIAKKDMDQLFQPFNQVNSSIKKEYKGIGLGLALAKRLIKLLNGKIWVESEGPGKGSVFKFIFPC
ncbi:MAG: PAS domain-containing sensor histidine kinase [bacterium]|nr:PAS domain-containing sensor histidine kinase [bacterium]